MAIERLPVRAKIIGAGLNAETPYITSFSVNRGRGQPATFQCSVKMLSGSVGITGGQVEIYAGSPSADILIFTGVLLSATVTPCWDDPSYVMINASGSDILKMLEGKKFTRRQRTNRSVWCEITGVARKGIRSQKLKFISRNPSLHVTGGELNETAQTGTGLDWFSKDSTAEPSNGDKSSIVSIEFSFSD